MVQKAMMYVFCKVINEPWEAGRQTGLPNVSLLAVALGSIATNQVVELPLNIIFALSSQQLNMAAVLPPQQRD